MLALLTTESELRKSHGCPSSSSVQIGCVLCVLCGTTVLWDCSFLADVDLYQKEQELSI